MRWIAPVLLLVGCKSAEVFEPPKQVEEETECANGGCVEI